MKKERTGFGVQLKHWRRARGMSQLSLSNEVGISAKHLCFIETERSKPSPEMIHKLSEGLDIPLRERNELLHLAGFAAHYSDATLSAPSLAVIRGVVSTLLKKQEPYPALVMDRHWNIVQANRAATHLLAPLEVQPPVSAIELYLGHPALKEVIENWSEVAFHLRERIRAQDRMLGGKDSLLSALAQRADELLAHEQPPHSLPDGPTFTTRLRLGDHRISTVSTMVAFSGPGDALVDDLRIELIFPADKHTESYFQMVSERES